MEPAAWGLGIHAPLDSALTLVSKLGSSVSYSMALIYNVSHASFCCFHIFGLNFRPLLSLAVTRGGCFAFCLILEIPI